ncbi:ATP-binding protein [Aneurinibacillus terranovensis]|uniref:ATP-binding protein n=1 Tax=Aneurinibacillus terranovensis TaxID=278991 RepID=UPI000409CA0E|nr:ATP-binding protein [Aneurinibacillus terranovensis]
MLNYECTQLADDELKKHVDVMMNQVSDYLSLSPESLLYYNIYLSIWELLLNIINHNKAGDHTVNVAVWWTEKEIFLQIKHEGGGFDWENCMACELPSDEHARGRGLFLVSHVSKTFSFNSTGQIATVTFERV